MRINCPKCQIDYDTPAVLDAAYKKAMTNY